MIRRNAQAETFDQVYRQARALLNSQLKDYDREEICMDITAGTIMSVATHQATEVMLVSNHRKPDQSAEHCIY